jgi:5-methylcytosine-specific restriction endonuclease McrA
MSETLRSKIRKLREEGRSYNAIAAELNCSKSTVAYHARENSREAHRVRARNRRAKHPFVKRIEHFMHRRQRPQPKSKVANYRFRQILNIKLQRFFRRKDEMYDKPTFTVQDVIDKLGETPICYLTAQPIDVLQSSSYQFDHIVPASRGGENSLENLGICLKTANMAKSDMMLDEFLLLCRQVLENFGYAVKK